MAPKKHKQEWPKVSIIIVNFNGLAYTLKCIGSLRKLNYNNYEIIVVDNGSKDGSLEALRKIDDIKLIKNNENLGFAKANNIGISEARGEYIALLNNDTIVKKNWLIELVKALKADKGLGLAMSKVYNKYGAENYIFDGYGTTTLLGFSSHYGHINKNTKALVEIFSPCAIVLYKKDMIKTPFDPDYFLYYEDQYLGWLMRLKGFSVKIVPTSVVYHEGNVVAKNIKELSNFFVYLGERNRLMNIFLFYETKTIIKLLPQILFSTLILNIYDFKRIPIRLKSYFWLVRNLGKIMKKRKNLQRQRKVSDSEMVKWMSCKLFDEESFGSVVFRKPMVFFNRLNYCYCWLFNIRTIEFYPKEEIYAK